MLNHMAEEGWCVQLALNPEDFWVFMVHDRRPVHYTVASVITELVKWCWEVTLSLLCLRCPTLRCFPYGAGCRSVRRTAQSAPSPAALPAPSACFTVQHGSGKGEIGHEHNYGWRWVQQIDRTHSVEEREGVYTGAGPRSKRHQRALEGNVCTLCGKWNCTWLRLSSWFIYS